MSSTRALLSLQALIVVAIGGSTYHLRSHHIYNLQEHEARMDELEGTLRGHIGFIEDALDRLEGKKAEGKMYVLLSISSARTLGGSPIGGADLRC